MTTYTFQLDFYQDKHGDENALACVYFDGVCQVENFKVVSTDVNTPNTFEFTVDREPGTYELAVTFMNDSYEGEGLDRNIHWTMTRIDGVEARWRTFMHGNIEKTADIDDPAQSGWWPVAITGVERTSTNIVLPFDWNAV